MSVGVVGAEVRDAAIAPLEEEHQGGLRRYQAICVAAILAACIPYLFVAWDEWTGRINPLGVDLGDTSPIYDVQARAIMHGHLSIRPGSIGFEAFFVNGHQYTYFGLFPSLLRIPIFLFTSSLDGKLFGPSITAAWIVTAVFCSLLLWRLRIFLRGNAPLGWLEAASYGVFLVSILVGSVLVFLASRPDGFNEDEAWSVALFCGSLFALVGVIERPSWRRITLCGALVLLTNLNRPTTGYAAILAMLLVALWFALGREGRARRHWARALAGAALVSLAIGCAIDFAKFGMLFGVPFSSQGVFHAFGLQKNNGGRYTSLHWLPSTLRAYVDPTHFGFSSVFPYVVLPDEQSGLLGGGPTASIPLSMPLLFLSGLWGVTTTFMPGRSKPFRAMRVLLIASAVPVAALMFYGWIFERFVADFLPLLVLAGMIGMVDLWRRLDSRPRSTRMFVSAVVGALAWLSIWANLGFAVSPNGFWHPTQLANFINVQRAFSNVTGHPLDHKVVVGWQYPEPEPVGTLFVRGRCTDLFLSYATVPKPGGALFYLPVERSPHTPICDSLIKKR